MIFALAAGYLQSVARARRLYHMAQFGVVGLFEISCAGYHLCPLLGCVCLGRQRLHLFRPLGVGLALL